MPSSLKARNYGLLNVAFSRLAQKTEVFRASLIVRRISNETKINKPRVQGPSFQGDFRTRHRGKQKVASIADRNVKKSEGYKQAKRVFNKQRSNKKWSGGRDAVVLSYTLQDIAERAETKK